jgi:hypothetical protein
MKKNDVYAAFLYARIRRLEMDCKSKVFTPRAEELAQKTLEVLRGKLRERS